MWISMHLTLGEPLEVWSSFGRKILYLLTIVLLEMGLLELTLIGIEESRISLMCILHVTRRKGGFYGELWWIEGRIVELKSGVWEGILTRSVIGRK